MTPGCNFISNCRIHDTNQHRTFNEGGVKLRGVKNTFSSNEVYNITDIALNFAIAGDAETSLDCVIENNSFHDVILNGKDSHLHTNSCHCSRCAHAAKYR